MRKGAATAKSGVLTALLVGDTSCTGFPLARCQGAPGEMSGSFSRRPKPHKQVLHVAPRTFIDICQEIMALDASQHTLVSFGTHPTRLICSALTRLGKLCHVFCSIAPRSFSGSDTNLAPMGHLDLFPMPYAAWSAEDMKSLHSRHKASHYHNLTELGINPVAADRLNHGLD